MVTLTEIDPATAVSFSGHRPERLPGKGDPDAPEMRKLTDALRQEIIAAVDWGMTAYLQGGMCGWDVVCGEQVIALKKEYPHIKLVTVAPYAVHFFSRESCWTPEWIDRAQAVFRQHDFGISLAEHYRKGIYFERNDTLIQYSSLLICYHDGGAGGTQYTVRKAMEKSLTIRNLYGGEVR